MRFLHRLYFQLAILLVLSNNTTLCFSQTTSWLATDRKEFEKLIQLFPNTKFSIDETGKENRILMVFKSQMFVDNFILIEGQCFRYELDNKTLDSLSLESLLCF